MMKRWMQLLLVACAVLVIGAGVARAEIIINPAQITISATRGAVETRTITLRPDADVTGVQAISQDLQREDGTSVLPANRIAVALDADALAANSVVSVMLTVDLQGVAAGTYTGELLINSSDGVTALPLTINVKDGSLWAILVLALGVLFGVGTTWYRSRLMPRDEVLSQFAKLSRAVEADSQFPPEFKERIAVQRADVARALEDADWDAARKALAEAQNVRYAWERQRAAWLQRIKTRDELRDYVNGLLSDGLDIPAAILDRLAAVIDPAVTPEGVFESLRALRDQIKRFEVVARQLQTLNERSLAAGDSGLQQAIPALTARLERVRLDDESEIAALEAEVADAVARTEPEVTRGIADLDDAIRERDVRQQVERLIPAVERAADEARRLFAQPDGRLLIYVTISYVLLAAVLVATGYVQLYQNQATFGAGGIADYIALFAFGFGSEAARATVADVLRGIDLPFTRS